MTQEVRMTNYRAALDSACGELEEIQREITQISLRKTKIESLARELQQLAEEPVLSSGSASRGKVQPFPVQASEVPSASAPSPSTALPSDFDPLRVPERIEATNNRVVANGWHR